MPFGIAGALSFLVLVYKGKRLLTSFWDSLANVEEQINDSMLIALFRSLVVAGVGRPLL